MFKHIFAGAFALFSLGTPAWADGSDDRLQKLRDIYQCPIYSYLVAIHRTPLKYKDRYLTVAINYAGRDKNLYAQCIFYDKDRKMHCEAASPFYDETLTPFFDPNRLAVLRALGYTTKPSKSNYHLEHKAPNADALYDIAGLLVETLGRVFDMQLDETLTYHAPLVKQTPEGGVDGSNLCTPKISSR